MHRLIDAGLIGAERTAPLQDKRNAIAAFGPPSFTWAGGKRCVMRVRTSCMANHSKMRMGDRFSALPKQVTAR
jgi:hypothetical protein